MSANEEEKIKDDEKNESGGIFRDPLIFEDCFESVSLYNNFESLRD
jgi:hypothetical protein